MYEITKPYHPFSKKEIEEIKDAAKRIGDNLNELNISEILKEEIRVANDEIQLFDRCPDIESSLRLYELYAEISCIIAYGIVLD